jgi:hypothetical protein
MASYLPNQLFQEPLAELQPDPTQPRKYMDPAVLDEMTASVSQVGIIQSVVCRQDPVTGLVYVVAPSSPKNVLVEITQKKPERGVLTKFGVSRIVLIVSNR